MLAVRIKVWRFVTIEGIRVWIKRIANPTTVDTSQDDQPNVLYLISKVYRRAPQGSLADMESRWVTNHAERFDSC